MVWYGMVVLTSTPSDGPKKNGKGNFILLDGETFKPKGKWLEDEADEGQYGWVAGWWENWVVQDW